jgi:hypothetical protein
MVDSEIMKKLSLKRTQYYQYKKKLFTQSAKAFETSKMSDLAFHKELLHDRLTKLYRQADMALQIDPETNQLLFLDSKDYANVLLASQNIAINLFKLESEGLRILEQYFDVNRKLTDGSIKRIGERPIQLLPSSSERAEGGGASSVEASIDNSNEKFNEQEIY